MKVQSIPIIFRCDASSKLGWGQFRRCYALAEVAQQSSRFKVHFLTRPLHKSLRKKLSEIHATVQILKEESSIEEDIAALHSMFDMMSRRRIIVCIDQKDWTPESLTELKRDSRVILVVFDDGMKRHYEVDFLVNHHLDAEGIGYSTSSNCQRLLGPKYVMVRDEIQTLRQHPTERMAEVFQFLVTLGGGDSWGHTLKAIEAVKQSPIKFETHIVCPSDWPHVDMAKRMIGNHPRIHLYEDPSFFPQLLARADLTLCAAGMTTYELAYLGIPMLTVAINSVQQRIGETWQKRGVAEHLGFAEGLTPQLILEKLHYWMERDQELEERGVRAQKIVDGRGKFRVLERISKFIDQKNADSLSANSAE